MSAFVFLVYESQMEHVYIGSVGSYESTKGRKMKTLKPLAPALQGSERELLTTGVHNSTSILICIKNISGNGYSKNSLLP